MTIKIWKLMTYISSIIFCVFCVIMSVFLHSEAATRGVLWEKVFLEILQNSQETTCARVSFLTSLKKTLTQVFFCDFWEIFKNTFLTEHLRPTATYFFKLQANLGDTCRRKVKLAFPRYCKQTNLKDVYSWEKMRSLKGY